MNPRLGLVFFFELIDSLIRLGDNQVGNEFSSVEALWSQFENFMGPAARPEQNENDDENQDHDGENGGDEEK